MNRITKTLLLLLAIFGCTNYAAADDTAKETVKSAIEYWRGETSKTVASMEIHRPDWQRTMSMEVQTKGRNLSLVRFTAPKRDAGNASLVIDKETWSYSPKINRIIKIPSSMKTQSWMESDFSYNDLSKADDIIDQYTHTIVRHEKHENMDVSVVESIPKENAPIVWGKEILFIRQDNIIVRHEFYDQEMKLVKHLEATKIEPLGGKIFAKNIRMTNDEEEQEWTIIVHEEASFGLDIPDSTFTQSNLRRLGR